MFFLGICIHAWFLMSIFDIYFKSPIVKNVSPYEPQHEAVADRLVLFVVDGLRAESFVNHTTMPYLRSIANTEGRWGISHTRVPTESRPGHVAVIAGFYEDPSAIARGWKENPVDFDSVFNQTAYTWCWGTYDIIEIFTKGGAGHHIFGNKYDPYSKTFSTDQNTTLLDAWVFDSVIQFFKNASNDRILKEKLIKRKIAFFLHLLGTDTSGHTHKPKTEQFLTTIKYVDERIQEIETIIKEFYNDDGKTTFLMTSDHGMTDWGSHGAGDNHETQTPYVVWGAGVKKVTAGKLDPETVNMSLEHRLDMNQADLTPLMSTILSIPVPVNSVGQLRSDVLNLSLADKAKAIYSNSRQLASQYNRKRSDVQVHAIQMFHQPFQPFTKEKYDEMLAFTEKLLANGDYDKLILLSEEIIDLSLKGLTYYHNYYQRTLLILVTLSFIGWTLWLLKAITEQNINTQPETTTLNNHSLFTNFVFKFIIIALVLFCTFLVYAQNLPIQYYIHFLLPLLLWSHVLSSAHVWLQLYRRLKRRQNVSLIWIEILGYIMGSMALGLSFSYRWMLSIPLLGMGLWPFMSFPKNKWPTPVLLSWLLGCALLSLFSFMPVVGRNVFIELVILAGMLWLLTMLVYVYKFILPLHSNNQENHKEIVLIAIQMLMLVISLHNIFTQSRRFEMGTPVSYVDQAVAWIISVACFVIPLMHSRKVASRLLAANTSLLNFYLLLSVAHEGLFMVTLILNVTCWICMEFRLLHLENVQITTCTFDEDSLEQPLKSFISFERTLSNQDFRRAFFYITYIVVAFFGTGNIASLNSFEVRWVTCFITAFQPFLITGLILLKTLAPFLVVACSFRAIQHITKAPTGFLHIIVLIYSNIMGIQLLYYVKNTGSWLEIGTSISQYVIVQLITLFIVLMNQIAKALTYVSIHSIANEVFRSRKKYV